MDALNVLLTIVIGVMVRFAIPIAITIVAIWFFRRLDARWQTEARERMQAQMALAVAGRTPCWEQRQCPAEKLASCPVYAQRNVPCWQVFRDNDGNLKPACLDCGVFRDAPIPLLI